ncbi:MAG TPA: polysaccharide biosynthesis protein [Alphaproteobacteria bacterium]|nr:polysaccharide biosynthesis protein [Alphaproteobacteria bacterium]
MQLPQQALTRQVALIHDLLCVPIAWIGAFWFRFDFGIIPPANLEAGLAALPLLIVVQAALFFHYGLYRGVWRFASLPDLLRILKAVVVGVSIAAFVLFIITRLQDVPRTAFVMYGLFLIGLLSGPRFIYRWFKDRCLYQELGARVLIIGAGRAGEMLVRDMLRDPNHGYLPVGFIDDHRSKAGMDVHGIRVLGRSRQIGEFAQKLDIDTILIAMPSATSKQMRRIANYCERTGLPVLTLPKLSEFLSAKTSLGSLRTLDIGDLLGREPIELSWMEIGQGLIDKSILISGGGGSIGSELCRQVARLGPKRLVVFEKSEFNLYTIDRELRTSFPDLEIHSVLGDICDAVAVGQAMKHFQPEVIYHAAAYKHVPLLEGQIREAVRNNILGTVTMARAADAAGVGTFVTVSTDKAVNPTSVMGMTKRISEVWCQNSNSRSDTNFVTVRFGNVLNSAGSVVPLFRQQIESGGPVTVTHPEVERYFMTISEASQLIMQAGVLGSGGEIYVLDMGEPMLVQYLAEQMIRLSGKVPGDDIKIEYVGLRPGEKMFEELFHEREALRSTAHNKIMLAQFREVEWNRLSGFIADLESATEKYDNLRLRAMMLELVPEAIGQREHTPDVVPIQGASDAI